MSGSRPLGAGRDLRGEEWPEYLTQMLNSGVIDIAYDEAHSLKLNEISWRVLRGERKVELVRFESYEQKRQRQEEQAEPVKRRKKSFGMNCLNGCANFVSDCG